jgi:hypothetical protein
MRSANDDLELLVNELADVRWRLSALPRPWTNGDASVDAERESLALLARAQRVVNRFVDTRPIPLGEEPIALSSEEGEIFGAAYELKSEADVLHARWLRSRFGVLTH